MIEDIIRENRGNRKIAIWGACAAGKLARDFLMRLKIPIEDFYVDKRGNGERFCGVKTYQPSYLLEKKNVYVLIATFRYRPEIERFLLAHGYKKEYDYVYMNRVIENVHNFSDELGNHIIGGAECMQVDFRGFDNEIRIGEGVEIVDGTVNIRIIGNGNVLSIGSLTTFEGKTQIDLIESSALEIDEECSFMSGTIIHVIANSNAHIGKQCSFGNKLFMTNAFESQLVIGDDCMSSHDVSIIVGDGHPIYDLEERIQLNKGKKTVIGKHVWLGNKCTILSNVILGDNCIVGSNSLVTQRYMVEKNSVLGGNPARVLHSNMRWERDITFLE